MVKEDGMAMPHDECVPEICEAEYAVGGRAGVGSASVAAILVGRYTETPLLAGVREKVESRIGLGCSSYWTRYERQPLMLRRGFATLCGVRRLSSLWCVLTRTAGGFGWFFRLLTTWTIYRSMFELVNPCFAASELLSVEMEEYRRPGRRITLISKKRESAKTTCSSDRGSFWSKGQLLKCASFSAAYSNCFGVGHVYYMELNLIDTRG